MMTPPRPSNSSVATGNPVPRGPLTLFSVMGCPEWLCLPKPNGFPQDSLSTELAHCKGEIVLDCSSAAADRQLVGLLDAVAASWGNGTSAGSAADAVARLLSNPRSASLQRGSRAAGRHACLARRGLPFLESFACGHPADPVLTKQGT